MFGIVELGVLSVVALPLLVGLALSILTLVDAARRPAPQWQAAQQQQALWVALSTLGIIVWPVGLVVGVVYLSVIRRQLDAVTG